MQRQNSDPHLRGNKAADIFTIRTSTASYSVCLPTLALPLFLGESIKPITYSLVRITLGGGGKTESAPPAHVPSSSPSHCQYHTDSTVLFLSYRPCPYHCLLSLPSIIYAPLLHIYLSLAHFHSFTSAHFITINLALIVIIIIMFMYPSTTP